MQALEAQLSYLQGIADRDQAELTALRRKRADLAQRHPRATQPRRAPSARHPRRCDTGRARTRRSVCRYPPFRVLLPAADCYPPLTATRR